MPYVNIPESRLGGIVSKQIGKLQGDVVGKVLKESGTIIKQLQETGCATPSAMNRNRNKLNSLKNAINGVNGKLSKFKSIPKKLKPPVRGFKSILKIILALPIPQAVPPGFGIPVSITTKYADLLHLVKESIKQVEEVITSVEVALETPGNSLKSVDRLLSKADINIRTCEMKHSLDESIRKGDTDDEELIRLGLAKRGINTATGEEELDYIFNDLGPRVLSDANDSNYRGKWVFDPNQFYFEKDRVTYEGGDWECLEDHQPTKEDYPGSSTNKWRSLAENTDQLISSDLEGKLLEIQNSNLNDKVKEDLKNLLNQLKIASSTEVTDTALGESEFLAPNGEVYFLEIISDINSPAIAPRRFAVAKDKRDIIVFRGPKSFSSSTTVLIDTLKLSIINQLS